MRRTYLDAGVLIAALRRDPDLVHQIDGLLADPDRAFVSSVFLRLEVLPKAVYHKRAEDIAWFEAFFCVGGRVGRRHAVADRSSRTGSAAARPQRPGRAAHRGRHRTPCRRIDHDRTADEAHLSRDRGSRDAVPDDQPEAARVIVPAFRRGRLQAPPALRARERSRGRGPSRDGGRLENPPRGATARP